MVGSDSKRICLNEDDNLESGVDRLSSLPDDILHIILSLVGMKDAPKTHGLSKRWRFLWAYCPMLYFIIDGPSGVSPHFVDNVISQYRGLELRCLGINIHYDEDLENFTYFVDFPLDKWVQFAVDRDVSVLCLNFIPDGLMLCKGLPHALFYSSSIRLLILRTCEIHPPLSVCMSSLEKVELKQVRFDRCAFEIFTSGCPELETIIMEDCNLYGDMSIHITNPSIKRISIKERPLPDGENAREIFYLDAPSLKFLEIRGLLRANYIIKNVSALVVAKLEFAFYNYGDASILKGLLNGLKCPNLHLCAWCIQVLSLGKIENHCIAPLHVKHLHLRLPLLKCELLGLSRMVEVFPSLQFLTINFGFWNDGQRLAPSDDMHVFDFSITDFCNSEWDEVLDENEGSCEGEFKGWKSIGVTFSSHLQNLRKIELKGFFQVGNLLGLGLGFERNSYKLYWKLFCRELQLVKNLLTNSPALEVTKIEFPACRNLDAARELAIRDFVCSKVYDISPTSSNAETIFWRRRKTH